MAHGTGTEHTPPPVRPADGAGPPTPPVPLADLLADASLGLEPAGRPGPEGVRLQWVHSTEMADPFPYLLGGELVLTAGMPLRGATPADVDAYVARLVAAGAAALGFGVAPVWDTVPGPLSRACARHGLPLVVVPPGTPFTAVARAVWRLMAEARDRGLRREAEAQRGLAAAASRPDPVPAVLQQLASGLGGRAAVYAADGTELWGTGPLPSPEAGAALRRLAGVVGPPEAPGGRRFARPASAAETIAGADLTAYALGGGGLVLGVAARSRPAAAGDRTVAGTATVLMSLLLAPDRDAEEAGRRAALVRLLLGAAPRDGAAPLGPGPWTVVHARGGGTPFAASALGAALGSALVEAGEEAVRIVTRRPVTAQPGWVLGVSDPVGAGDLPSADLRAARALRRAVATRAPLVRHGAADGGLGDLVDPADADAHARRLLAPLEGSPALVETLRTWLSLHGGWEATALALGVHRNTVRQRIARCAALLGADLDDPDVRMELWFALRRA